MAWKQQVRCTSVEVLDHDLPNTDDSNNYFFLCRAVKISEHLAHDNFHNTVEANELRRDEDDVEKTERTNTIETRC